MAMLSQMCASVNVSKFTNSWFSCLVRKFRGVQAARSSISEHESGNKCILMPMNTPMIIAHITQDMAFTDSSKVMCEAHRYI